MGSRSRKRRPGAARPAPVADPAAPRLTAAQRTEAKNAAVRATLEPLGAGERPPWVTAAAVFAALLGVLNIVLYLAGVRVEGSTFAGTVILGAVLLVAAGGMWAARYWAVLGFEVLLGVTCVFGALSLLVASSIPGALRSLLVIAISGTFFWKLIRAMARIQMPTRR
ncbi:MAG: hypothetical protein QOH43_294 [Solirubrobacteraceae bacterium]|nr:hypothetical protein [Solirubrobacteraceae bacterium]